MKELIVDQDGLFYRWLSHYNGSMDWEFLKGRADLCYMTRCLIKAIIATLIVCAVVGFFATALLSVPLILLLVGNLQGSVGMNDFLSVLTMVGTVVWFIIFIALFIFIVVPFLWGQSKKVARMVGRTLPSIPPEKMQKAVSPFVLIGAMVHSKMHKYCVPVKLKQYE